MTPTQAAALLAEGIAIAEGYPNPAHLPWKARNPGDLHNGDQGNGTINSTTVYPDHATGWKQLETEALRILTGQSENYKPGMSLAQIAATYTDEENAPGWAKTVAAHLGISVNDPISALLTQ
jgi:hypothetical protein